MRITRVYRNTGLEASKLSGISRFVNNWGHHVWCYKLKYGPEEQIDCESLDGVKSVIASRGDTRSHLTHLESPQGRRLILDTTNPTRITMEIDDKNESLSFATQIEKLFALQPLPRRIFVSHGRSRLWLEVQRFIERDAHLNLEAVELADEPSRGLTIAAKLEDVSKECSYAVIVMTGEDLANDEVRVRENVMHEIGFFQGRYGAGRVCLMHEDGVNTPSNLAGIVYCGFRKDDIRSGFIDLLRELRVAFPS